MPEKCLPLLCHYEQGIAECPAGLGSNPCSYLLSTPGHTAGLREKAVAIFLRFCYLHQAQRKGQRKSARRYGEEESA